jgi:hypothetical protein
MVIGPGTAGIVAHVILADGELIPENFNNVKVVVYRRGESTGRELQIIKPLGELADPELLKKPDPPVCTYSGDGNPLHEHADKTWWHYDASWNFENGPFSTYEAAYTALEAYCTELQRAKEESEKESLTKAEEIDRMVVDEFLKQFPVATTDGSGN